MVKRQFQNLDLECWEHPGKLGLSRPFICLQGDAAAADVVLAAIDELAANEPPCRRTLTLQPHARPEPILTLKISLVLESDELLQMSLTRENTLASLEFTAKGMEEFRRAVMLWRNGGEDLSIHPDGSRKARHIKKRDELRAKDLASGELWFWTPYTNP